MRLSLGDAIERYTVQSVLGEGGTATVYGVKHNILGTRHALKVLHRSSPAIREMLVREGQLQARLDPAFVVPVTDVLSVDGAPALVMPLVEGCALDELLQDHELTPAETSAVMSSICEGVTSAHRARVSHRDLKPANVLMDEKHGRVRVRVADFGLGRAGDDPEDSHGYGFVGTPAYAAPEQLESASHTDERADLWSLGVILYRLLAGRLPFGDGDAAAMLAATSDRGLDLEPVPEAWRSLVAGLLEIDPAKRRPEAVHLVKAVQACCPPAELTVGTPIAEVIRKRVAQRGDELAVGQELVDPSTFGREAPTVTEVSGGEEKSSTVEVKARFNLPPERDRFIGRKRDIEGLGARLAEGAHLVSVIGIGGTGKTRLVTRYGWDQVSNWEGGVWFCDLCEARSKVGINQAVARGLNVPLGNDDPVQQLGNSIAGRGRCLIILDNFEQVARYARDTLERWLNIAPEAAFVVTSREVLGLTGEVPLLLAPLVDEDSVALFMDRASTAKPDFTANEEELAAIHELVALLDHLPLAIELAAARVRVLSPSKLLGRMSDRFRVLTSRGGRRDRQATLRATLDWSWNLLAPWEQATLAQVSVCEGGFDLDAAEAIVDLSTFEDAEWPIDVVQSLVDKSLVRTVGDDRFGLLVSVHDYAAERLDETGARKAAESRHGEWFASKGSWEAIEALDRHGGIKRLQGMALELDNLVVATQRALESNLGEIASATMVAAWSIFEMKGPYADAAALAERILERVSLTTVQSARVQRIAGRARFRQGETAQAVVHLDQALSKYREAGERGGEGVVLSDRSTLLHVSGERQRAAKTYLEALEVLRAVGDRRFEGVCLANLGLFCMEGGMVEEAKSHYQAALAILQDIGCDRVVANVTGNLGVLYGNQGELDKARDFQDRALHLHRKLGDRRSEGIDHTNLGALFQTLGRKSKARGHYEAAIQILGDVGIQYREGDARRQLGEFQLIEGENEAAEANLKKAIEMCETSFAGGAGVAYSSLGLLASRRGNQAEARELATQGESTLRDVGWRIQLAIAMTRRVEVEWRGGDPGAAREALAKASELATQLKVGAKSQLAMRISGAEELLSESPKS